MEIRHPKYCAVAAVLDIDSKELAAFDETDRQHLEAICQLLSHPF